ncbi:predicted protein [Nematostella vectensis]|uniref:G-protein coupled receptors family 1 profile domain-containing protein n=1 Tax=Nematostella vectensis TaxID=45351 RepID=A7S158_NEMVE|nr:D(2) dopamine receptor [Nematostella vectensis]EDO42579.1 predicted protein [Nematostella vectensis]|eukprot:XP_001634642.1 predicted protein [Nematostella vectensis]
MEESFAFSNYSSNGKSPGEGCVLPQAHAIAMFVINILFSALGTVGNLLVCGAVLSTPTLRRISNYLICSLAVADLFITMSGQPLLAVMLWGRLHAVCYDKVELAFRAIGNVSCAASLLSLCFISIDRCVAISKPFRYNTIMTYWKLGLMLLFAWGFPSAYTYVRLQVSKKITSYITVGMFGAGYAVLAGCYIVIFIKTLKQAKERKRLLGYQRQKQSIVSQRTERRLATTILLIIAVFTVAWAPLFYLRVKQPKKNYGIAYDWARTIALSSSAVNPALYCLRNEEYRKAFKRILLLLFCCKGKKGQVEITRKRAPTQRTASTSLPQ